MRTADAGQLPLASNRSACQCCVRPMTILRFVPVMLALGVAAAAGQESDAKLDRFFKRYLEESFQLRPMQATQLGNHRFDNLLDDLSPSARKGWIEHARKTLRELPKAVDYPKLSRPGQIDYEILEHELSKSI